MSSFVARFSILIVALFVLAVCTATATAQSVTGSISGVVTDASGGVIVGASVTLTSKGTGATRTDTTNSEGRFSLSALQPGVYTLMIERSGFQRLEIKNAVLTLNENLA